MNIKNEKEPTNNAQIHLRATDAEKDEDASKIVFHKMADKTMFIEVEPNREFSSVGAWRLQFNLDEHALNKLKEYFKNETTY